MRPSLRALQALVLAPYLLLAGNLWFVCDDAYISFRYARNAALGHGFRYNLGDELPVEGYSNFLWTALAALVELVGAPPEHVLPAISLLCGAGLLLHLTHTAHRLGLGPVGVASGGLLLACSPSFGAWATSGLDTMPMAWALFALVERLVLARGPSATRAAVLAAMALCLIRTEGPAWMVVVVGLALGVRLLRREERPWSEPLTVLGAAGLVVAAHVGWRYATYGDVISNTARAKVGLSTARVLRGLTYVLGTWAALIMPAVMLLGLPSAVHRWGLPGLALALMAVGVPAWCVLVGGDYMTFGRLLLPGLPFAALCAAAAFDNLATRFGPRAGATLLAAACALSLLPAFDLHLLPATVRNALFFRTSTPSIKSELHMWRYMKANAQRWTVQGKALAQLPAGGSLVTGAIGARGYFSDLYIHDRGGLVTRGLEQWVSDDAEASPGHDVQAPRSAFLDLKPTWMEFHLLPGDAGPKEVLREVKEWRVPKAWRTDYGPKRYPVQVDGKPYLLIMLERSDQAEALWAEVEGQVPQEGPVR